MSEARRIIEVDGFDHRLMVKGLSEFRNELIEQQLPTEDVNKLFSPRGMVRLLCELVP